MITPISAVGSYSLRIFTSLVAGYRYTKTYSFGGLPFYEAPFEWWKQLKSSTRAAWQLQKAASRFSEQRKTAIDDATQRQYVDFVICSLVEKAYTENKNVRAQALQAGQEQRTSEKTAKILGVTDEQSARVLVQQEIDQTAMARDIEAERSMAYSKLLIMLAQQFNYRQGVITQRHRDIEQAFASQEEVVADKQDACLEDVSLPRTDADDAFTPVYQSLATEPAPNAVDPHVLKEIEFKRTLRWYSLITEAKVVASEVKHHQVRYAWNKQIAIDDLHFAQQWLATMTEQNEGSIPDDLQAELLEKAVLFAQHIRSHVRQMVQNKRRRLRGSWRKIKTGLESLTYQEEYFRNYFREHPYFSFYQDNFFTASEYLAKIFTETRDHEISIQNEIRQEELEAHNNNKIYFRKLLRQFQVYDNHTDDGTPSEFNSTLNQLLVRVTNLREMMRMAECKREDDAIWAAYALGLRGPAHAKYVEDRRKKRVKRHKQILTNRLSGFFHKIGSALTLLFALPVGSFGLFGGAAYGLWKFSSLVAMAEILSLGAAVSLGIFVGGIVIVAVASLIAQMKIGRSPFLVTTTNLSVLILGFIGFPAVIVLLSFSLGFAPSILFLGFVAVMGMAGFFYALMTGRGWLKKGFAEIARFWSEEENKISFTAALRYLFVFITVGLAAVMLGITTYTLTTTYILEAIGHIGITALTSVFTATLPWLAPFFAIMAFGVALWVGVPVLNHFLQKVGFVIKSLFSAEGRAALYLDFREDWHNRELFYNIGGLITSAAFSVLILAEIGYTFAPVLAGVFGASLVAATPVGLMVAATVFFAMILTAYQFDICTSFLKEIVWYLGLTKPEPEQSTVKVIDEHQLERQIEASTHEHDHHLASGMVRARAAVPVTQMPGFQELPIDHYFLPWKKPTRLETLTPAPQTTTDVYVPRNPKLPCMDAV